MTRWEDTKITNDDLRRDFGDEVGKLVDGVTKLTNLPRVSRGDQHMSEAESPVEVDPVEESRLARSRRQDLASETLRKTFMAMGEDIRVVLIKLADRLHNMRTLGFMPEAKRRRIAQETLDIFRSPRQPSGYLADEMGAGRSGIPVCHAGKNTKRSLKTFLNDRKIETGRY